MELVLNADQLIGLLLFFAPVVLGLYVAEDSDDLIAMSAIVGGIFGYTGVAYALLFGDLVVTDYTSATFAWLVDWLAS